MMADAGAAAAEHAHAKINLYLHVTGRRADGYHDLDSLAVFAQIADRLTVEPAPDLRLSLTGPFATGLSDASDDNLVLRAARSLQGRNPILGAHLALEKRLPVASGIGGGSADAAASLRLLSRFWRSGKTAGELHEIARSLGADVPVCLAQVPTRMLGIGDILQRPPVLPPFGMVLINCGEPVSTQAVFRSRAPEFRAAARLPGGWEDAAGLAHGLAGLSNDLEQPAIALCPAIAGVLASLRSMQGCLLARMSGSGATCFGLFGSPSAARSALQESVLPRFWWSWAGGVLP